MTFVNFLGVVTFSRWVPCRAVQCRAGVFRVE